MEISTQTKADYYTLKERGFEWFKENSLIDFLKLPNSFCIKSDTGLSVLFLQIIPEGNDVNTAIIHWVYVDQFDKLETHVKEQENLIDKLYVSAFVFLKTNSLVQSACMTFAESPLSPKRAETTLLTPFSSMETP